MSKLQLRIDHHVRALEKILITTEPEYIKVHLHDNPNNWQAGAAREICEILLRSSKACGLGGCELCQA